MTKPAPYSGFFTPSPEALAGYESEIKAYYGNQILRTLGTGLGAGAGATALYHLFNRLRGDDKEKEKYVGYGTGGTVETKTAASTFPEWVGGLLPKNLIPFKVPGLSGGATVDPSAMRAAWATAANLGAGAAGLFGGSALVNMAAKSKKEEDTDDEIEAARQDYYRALAGDKNACALDAAFEKSAVLPSFADIGGAIYGSPQAIRTAYLLAMLGAGGLGAKYMYDKTRAVTDSHNLSVAREARARNKSLPPIWVDPQSLAHVKSRAESNE
jgi:hypothetical protein